MRSHCGHESWSRLHAGASGEPQEAEPGSAAGSELIDGAHARSDHDALASCHRLARSDNEEGLHGVEHGHEEGMQEVDLSVELRPPRRRQRNSPTATACNQ
jgi:hypothetical protein